MITISDIAKAAGVSKSTVSKALNNHPSIPVQTKERILKIVKDLNYTPNSMAKQLAKRSSSTIAILIEAEKKDYYMNPFFYNIIGGVESSIFSKGFELEICNVNYFKTNEEFLERFVYSKKVDGIIIPYSIINKNIVANLNTLDFPYVVVGKPTEHFNFSWVDIDNTMGGEIAVTHLYDLGSRRIGFIGGTSEDFITHHRFQGYKNGLNKNHLPLDERLVRSGYPGKSSGFNLMKELIGLVEPPDAVICVDNITAFGALEALREAEISIPEELRIITFDNYPLAQYTTPPLTAIDIDTFQLGEAAAEILFKKIQTNTFKNQASLIIPELIIRKSTKIE